MLSNSIPPSNQYLDLRWPHKMANIAPPQPIMLAMLLSARCIQAHQGPVVQQSPNVHHRLILLLLLAASRPFAQLQRGVGVMSIASSSQPMAAQTTLLYPVRTAKMLILQVRDSCQGCDFHTLIVAGPSAPLTYHPNRIGIIPTNNTAQAIFPPQACVFVAKWAIPCIFGPRVADNLQS